MMRQTAMTRIEIVVILPKEIGVQIDAQDPEIIVTPM